MQRVENLNLPVPKVATKSTKTGWFSGRVVRAVTYFANRPEDIKRGYQDPNQTGHVPVPEVKHLVDVIRTKLFDGLAMPALKTKTEEPKSTEKQGWASWFKSQAVQAAPDVVDMNYDVLRDTFTNSLEKFFDSGFKRTHAYIRDNLKMDPKEFTSEAFIRMYFVTLIQEIDAKTGKKLLNDSGKLTQKDGVEISSQIADYITEQLWDNFETPSRLLTPIALYFKNSIRDKLRQLILEKYLKYLQTSQQSDSQVESTNHIDEIGGIAEEFAGMFMRVAREYDGPISKSYPTFDVAGRRLIRSRIEAPSSNPLNSQIAQVAEFVTKLGVQNIAKEIVEGSKHLHKRFGEEYVAHQLKSAAVDLARSNSKIFLKVLRELKENEEEKKSAILAFAKTLFKDEKTQIALYEQWEIIEKELQPRVQLSTDSEGYQAALKKFAEYGSISKESVGASWIARMFEGVVAIAPNKFMQMQLEVKQLIKQKMCTSKDPYRTPEDALTAVTKASHKVTTMIQDHLAKNPEKKHLEESIEQFDPTDFMLLKHTDLVTQVSQELREKQHFGFPLSIEQSSHLARKLISNTRKAHVFSKGQALTSLCRANRGILLSGIIDSALSIDAVIENLKEKKHISLEEFIQLLKRHPVHKLFEMNDSEFVNQSALLYQKVTAEITSEYEEAKEGKRIWVKERPIEIFKEHLEQFIQDQFLFRNIGAELLYQTHISSPEKIPIEVMQQDIWDLILEKTSNLFVEFYPYTANIQDEWDRAEENISLHMKKIQESVEDYEDADLILNIAEIGAKKIHQTLLDEVPARGNMTAWIRVRVDDLLKESMKIAFDDKALDFVAEEIGTFLKFDTTGELLKGEAIEMRIKEILLRFVSKVLVQYKKEGKDPIISLLTDVTTKVNDNLTKRTTKDQYLEMTVKELQENFLEASDQDRVYCVVKEGNRKYQKMTVGELKELVREMNGATKIKGIFYGKTEEITLREALSEKAELIRQNETEYRESVKSIHTLASSLDHEEVDSRNQVLIRFAQAMTQHDPQLDKTLEELAGTVHLKKETLPYVPEDFQPAAWDSMIHNISDLIHKNFGIHYAALESTFKKMEEGESGKELRGIARISEDLARVVTHDVIPRAIIDESLADEYLDKTLLKKGIYDEDARKWCIKKIKATLEQLRKEKPETFETFEWALEVLFQNVFENLSKNYENSESFISKFCIEVIDTIPGRVLHIHSEIEQNHPELHKTLNIHAMDPKGEIMNEKEFKKRLHDQKTPDCVVSLAKEILGRMGYTSKDSFKVDERYQEILWSGMVDFVSNQILENYSAIARTVKSWKKYQGSAREVRRSITKQYSKQDAKVIAKVVEWSASTIQTAIVKEMKSRSSLKVKDKESEKDIDWVELSVNRAFKAFTHTNADQKELKARGEINLNDETTTVIANEIRSLLRDPKLHSLIISPQFSLTLQGILFERIDLMMNARKDKKVHHPFGVLMGGLLDNVDQLSNDLVMLAKGEETDRDSLLKDFVQSVFGIVGLSDGKLPVVASEMQSKAWDMAVSGGVEAVEPYVRIAAETLKNVSDGQEAFKGKYEVLAQKCEELAQNLTQITLPKAVVGESPIPQNGFDDVDRPRSILERMLDKRLKENGLFDKKTRLWIAEGVRSALASSKKNDHPIWNSIEGHMSTFMQFSAGRLLTQNGDHLMKQDPEFLKNVFAELTPKVLGHIKDTLVGSVSTQGTPVEDWDNYVLGLGEKILHVIFPDGKGFPVPEDEGVKVTDEFGNQIALKKIVWDTLASSISESLKGTLSPLGDPLKRKQCIANILGDTIVSHQKALGIQVKEKYHNREEKVLDGDAKKLLIGNIKTVIKLSIRKAMVDTWNNLHKSIDKGLSKVGGQFILKVKHAIDSIFHFVFMTVLGTALHILLFPVIWACSKFFDLQLHKLAKNIDSYLGREEHATLAKELIEDSFSYIQQGVESNDCPEGRSANMKRDFMEIAESAFGIIGKGSFLNTLVPKKKISKALYTKVMNCAEMGGLTPAEFTVTQINTAVSS